MFLCGMGLLVSSCAHRSPMFSPTAKLDPNSAILYGRFSINHDRNIFKNKLALWLQNTDTKHNVYVYFDEEQPVYAVQVKAGHYRIAGYAALNRTHQIKSRVPFQSGGKPAALTRQFKAAAHSEVYLGDFTGHTTFDGTVFEWNVDSVTNKFTTTTLEFRKNYPNLGSLPVTPINELQGAGSFGKAGIF